MKIKTIHTIVFICLMTAGFAQNPNKNDFLLITFGDGGQHKMIYDRRQRPQAVLMGENIHMVYNGGAPSGSKSKSETLPYAITFNLRTKSFSKSVQILGEPSKDHHFGPIIWADSDDFLHVLLGCHKTPGIHVISKNKASIGEKTGDWKIAEQIAPSLSYPSVSMVLDNQNMIYYRVGEHRSSWTYRISNKKSNTGALRKIPSLI